MRRTIVALLGALLIASGLTASAGVSDDVHDWSISSLDDLAEDRSEWWPDTAVLRTSREMALDWLEDNQAPDGTWGDDFGVTGIAAFALLNGGRDASHPAVARAISLILSEANEDGSFSEGTYVHYYTSAAVMALSAGGRAEDETIVADGVAMLVREQCDGDEEGFEEWWRGGIGYGGDGRPDMSNTQFALMALAAATGAYPSVTVPAGTWTDALIFLNRCQNLPEINDLDWADEASSPSFNDGGFVYFPGRSNAGDVDSYGSMTAAGLWCLVTAGEDIDSAAAAAALDWLGANFEADGNPNFGDTAYFYYTWAIARALRTAGAPALSSRDGTVVHWAKDLATALIARQGADGRWANTGSDMYWEGNPVVSTAFSALALEAMMPAEDAGLRLRTPDGGTMTIIDSQGRRDAESPHWSQETDGTVVLSEASDGPFRVAVEGAISVEVATEFGGTVRMWKRIELATDGGQLTVDVAPLLGPADLVISDVGELPEESVDGDASPGATVAMVLAAVVILAVVSSIASRSSERRRR